MGKNYNEESDDARLHACHSHAKSVAAEQCGGGSVAMSLHKVRYLVLSSSVVCLTAALRVLLLFGRRVTFSVEFVSSCSLGFCSFFIFE